MPKDLKLIAPIAVTHSFGATKVLEAAAIDQIRSVAVEQYIAQDGLMALESGGFRPPYDDVSDLETVANDNGILFLAYFYALLDRRGYKISQDDLQVIDRALTTTRHPKHPGLYHRNDGRSKYLNSLDNYVGIIALSALAKTNDAKEIIAWSKTNGWNFNNVNPDAWEWSAWRQPSHRLIYKLAANEKPNRVEWSWYYASVWVNRFIPFEQRSDLLLGWLMEWVITKLDPKEFETVRNRMVQITMKQHGGIQSVVNDYFKDESHPCRILASGLEF